MFSINFLPARQLGQVEFAFGVIKMAYLIFLIVFNITLHIMRPPDKEAFWTWNSPYSFAAQNFTLPNGAVVEGNDGRFLGMWGAITHGLFGLLGFETIAIAAAENRDYYGQETVKFATRKISIRIILLYSLCTFAAALNVPYEYPLLKSKETLSISFGESSIFVIAPVLSGLRVWPLFFNHFMIFTAATAGSMALYNASRTLHALASISEAWPEWAQGVRVWLARTTMAGVPHHAISVCGLFGLIGFVAQNPQSTAVSAGIKFHCYTHWRWWGIISCLLTSGAFPQILARMVRACVIGMLVSYGLVSASYIQFHKKLRLAADGKDGTIDQTVDLSLYIRDDARFPFKSRWQPLSAYYSTAACALIVLFNGWGTLVPPVNVHDFFGCYVSVIALPLVLVRARPSSGFADTRFLAHHHGHDCDYVSDHVLGLESFTMAPGSTASDAATSTTAGRTA